MTITYIRLLGAANACNKVRLTEPTKHTKLQTKTAECNASP